MSIILESSLIPLFCCSTLIPRFCLHTLSSFHLSLLAPISISPSRFNPNSHSSLLMPSSVWNLTESTIQGPTPSGCPILRPCSSGGGSGNRQRLLDLLHRYYQSCHQPKLSQFLPYPSPPPQPSLQPTSLSDLEVVEIPSLSSPTLPASPPSSPVPIIRPPSHTTSPSPSPRIISPPTPSPPRKSPKLLLLEGPSSSSSSSSPSPSSPKDIPHPPYLFMGHGPTRSPSTQRSMLVSREEEERRRRVRKARQHWLDARTSLLSIVTPARSWQIRHILSVLESHQPCLSSSSSSSSTLSVSPPPPRDLYGVCSAKEARGRRIMRQKSNSSASSRSRSLLREPEDFLRKWCGEIRMVHAGKIPDPRYRPNRPGKLTHRPRHSALRYLLT
ncbi:MAG: hypothetical protein DHS80DRAFT_26234 [Piptocephalis tieghemiana]|nr:MAG: hypothetical protein DHS80DRAFT_26234 [Piptocephalis tieghemiana]